MRATDPKLAAIDALILHAEGDELRRLRFARRRRVVAMRIAKRRGKVAK